MNDIQDIYKKAKDILDRAGIEDAAHDAKELLTFSCNINASDLIGNSSIYMTEEQKIKFYNCISDRARRIPLQHIMGYTYFYGRKIHVNGNVLVPRFDTEILVDEAMSMLKSGDRVLDLCTGSGCIIIALDIGIDNESGKYNFYEGVASDVSEAALDVACKNAKEYDISNISFVKGDLFENITGSFDMIVSNPPYIRTNMIDELSPEVQLDPRIALDGGEDGLLFYKKIIRRSVFFLNNGGHLILETGYDQKENVIRLLKDEGFSDINSIKDYGGHDRVISAILYR